MKDNNNQNQTTQSIIGASVGVIFMTAVLYIAFVKECPSDSLLFTLRVVLAIAVAAFSMVISGSLKIQYQGSISAGGSIAVFVLVYLFNPAGNIEGKHCNLVEPYQIRGSARLNGKVVESSKVVFGGGNIAYPRSWNINEVGQFGIEVSPDEFVNGHYVLKFNMDGFIKVVDTFINPELIPFFRFNFNVDEEEIETVRNENRSKIDSLATVTKEIANNKILKKGESLEYNKKYFSENNKYYLMLVEHDLSIYDAETNTTLNHIPIPNIAEVILQKDGNFCMYGSGGEFLWCAFTQPNGYEFLISNDGNLIITNKLGEVIWSTREN
mgnify:CR=1 FL=1